MEKKNYRDTVKCDKVCSDTVREQTLILAHNLASRWSEPDSS